MSQAANPEPERRWRAPLLSAGIGILAYGASHLMRRAPQVAESVYGQGLAPWIVAVLSRISGLVPFSIAEVAFVLYAAWLAVLGVRGITVYVRRRRTLRSVLRGGAQRALLHGGCLVTAFYLLWGFNYSRAPLTDRLGWPAWEGVEADEIVRLAEQSVEDANRSYRTLHGDGDAGLPTGFPDSRSELERALARGWDLAGAHLGLSVPDGPRGSTKWPLASELMARFGISGIYVPFTAEAHVIRGLPAVSAVQGMAHEQAHQRGIANEAEASFAGFVAGALSPDPLARYAAALFASRQLMIVLARLDRDAYQRLVDEYVPGVRRDLSDVREFWQRYRGVGMTIGSAVNHRYLRANRVPGGVASYGLSVRLLIEHARQSGEVVPRLTGVTGPGESTGDASLARPTPASISSNPLQHGPDRPRTSP
jgi:hypothetical protein